MKRYIHSINASNFKGSSFSTELKPVTVICGPNARGKSTRLDALELALRGTFSGKKPGSAMANAEIHERYATGATMVVGASMSDGWKLVRSLHKGKKSVERSDGYSGFPDGYRSPAALFDTGEFAGLSANERTKYLFRVLPPPDLGKLGPNVIVANLKNVKADPHTEAHEGAIEELAGVVQASYKDETGGVDFSIQDWLAGLVEGVRKFGNEAKAQAKTMKETILGGAQLRSPDAASLSLAEQGRAKARKELEQAQEALTTLNQQLFELRTKYADAKAKAESSQNVDVAAMRAEREQLEAQPPPSLAQVPDLTPSRQAMAAADTKLNELTAAANTAFNDLKHAELNLTAAKNQATCGYPIRPPEQAAAVGQAEQEVARIRAVLDAMEPEDAKRLTAFTMAEKEAAANLARLTLLLGDARQDWGRLGKEIAELEHADNCPYCAAHHAGWKDDILERKRADKDRIGLHTNNVTVAHDLAVAERARCQEAVERYLAQERTRAAHKSQLQAANFALAMAQADDARHREQVHEADRQARAKTENINRLQAEYDRLLTERLRTRNAEIEHIENVCSPAEDALEQAEKLHQTYTEQLQAESRRQARLNELAAALDKVKEATVALEQLPQLAAVGNTLRSRQEQVQKDADMARTICDGAERVHRQAVADAATAQQQAKARMECDKAEARAFVAGQLGEFLLELLGKCVVESVKPLVDTCNRLCGGLFRAGATVALQDGELGLLRDGQFVAGRPREASDSENLMLACALKVALAAHGSDLRIAIMDRFESLDGPTRLAFLRRMLELVGREELDQVIVVQVVAGGREEYSDISDPNFDVVEV